MTFKNYNHFYDTNSYIKFVFEQYHNVLNSYDNEDDYQEMRGLLGEWLNDYIGNMKNNDTDTFLNNYGYRKALFEYINTYNIDVLYYNNNQFLLNRLLICHIMYNYISQNIYIKNHLIYTY